MTLPAGLSCNAFTDGAPVSGALIDRANRWGSKGESLTRQQTLAPAQFGENDWKCPEVGWGVVLADRQDLSPADKAAGVDAPEPIRRLLAARGNAPVLRYDPELKDEKLARYFPDGSRQDPAIGLSDFGVARGRLPRYLLIVGSPTEVPWRLQFSLNRRHQVGRLDLPPEGLENYVAALLSEWQDAPSRIGHAMVWSTNVDAITSAMEATVADFIADAMKNDKDKELTVHRLAGDDATHTALLTGLVESQPGVVVTSSHGKTGPLDDPDAMRRSLGLPVDADHTTLDPKVLLGAWSPAGAVWYAQACCSAGINSGTSFRGLLQEETLAFRVVEAVGQLGAAVAPLPTLLLGAPNPLRAFIGHVEPTFDWTLRMPDTGQPLTTGLVNAIYPRLFGRRPVALAFNAHYDGVGELYARLADARRDVDSGVPDARDRATYYRLTAHDRESLVLLGDPTVMVPPLPSQA
ncbi:hypothetical protein LRS71_24590 [Rhodococcus pyridinivorans]|uniref:hypothetical protein n=1 Tax=Rhodococcus pyridinivorans TaxID=103816 RepID=UPI001E38FFFE|nr:hypothetical protein [Rhodococcus pyridinivorans]MCD5422692.1 hypothetical protein [Rhodococcus pyridinivorans]